MTKPDYRHVVISARTLAAVAAIVVAMGAVVFVGLRYAHWRELVGGVALLGFGVLVMRALYSRGADRADVLVQSRTLESTVDVDGHGGDGD